ncbi:MAG: hypothetical protein KME10_07170 [Plectolyngbya sp. WJT66-NPBG17]|nr:hypothetical protein [Plectolyngbya sp. WJT66-NPBG17]MBW4525277.1 hypothetical protein [Phormidium tanganyikae FI6-MK23]
MPQNASIATRGNSEIYRIATVQSASRSTKIARVGNAQRQPNQIGTEQPVETPFLNAN